MDNYDNPLSSSQLMELANSLGGISANQEKAQVLKNQMQLAMALRNQQMPQGRQLYGDHGGVYAAPSALQDLGAVAQNYVGYTKANQANQGMSDLANSDQQARMKMLSAILRSRIGASGGQQQDPQMQSMSDSGNAQSYGLDDPNAPLLQQLTQQ